jgi:hypothetical protein
LFLLDPASPTNVTESLVLPPLPHHRPWQTPRTSVTVRGWHFNDCLKCTMIYEVFRMCEVSRIDMDL